MLNQFIIVGVIQQVKPNTIEVLVETQYSTDSLSISFPDYLKDALKEGNLVGIKGYIKSSGLMAEKISQLSIKDEEDGH